MLRLEKRVCLSVVASGHYRLMSGTSCDAVVPRVRAMLNSSAGPGLQGQSSSMVTRRPAHPENACSVCGPGLLPRDVAPYI